MLYPSDPESQDAAKMTRVFFRAPGDFCGAPAPCCVTKIWSEPKRTSQNQMKAAEWG
jgi:hypothetical protein